MNRLDILNLEWPKSEKLLEKIDYIMPVKKKKSRQCSRSFYVAKDIKKGKKFTEDNIRSVSSRYSMHPQYLKDVHGKKAVENFEQGTSLDWNLFNK